MQQPDQMVNENQSWRSALFWSGFLAVATFVIVTRFWKLDQRPMHADEAVQAVIARDLWLEGRYQYDPDEYHGPTLPYATWARLKLGTEPSFAATSAGTFRSVPALFGAGLVILLLLCRDGLGNGGLVCSMLLYAVSPALTYYNRYFIHESLLVFFSFLLVATLWRYVTQRRSLWLIVAGFAVGLMQATKETTPLTIVALGMSLVMVQWLTARSDPKEVANGKLWRPRHVAGAALAAAITAGVFYSSFGSHFSGLLDCVRTYLPWLERAGGHSPHIHPWYYYMHILTYWQILDGPHWSEAMILALALLGGIIAWWPIRHINTIPLDRKFIRWMTLFTVLLAALYSAIPYKTPWCLMGFWQPATLVAGWGASRIIRRAKWIWLKGLLIFALGLGIGHLGWQAYLANGTYSADPRNPLAYAPTSPDIERLEEDVEQLLSVANSGEPCMVKVIWHDGYYWPMPWYLRKCDRIGYWTEVPEDPAAPLVIASAEHDTALTARLDATHLMTGFYAVRPGVLAQLWVRMDVWEAHLRRLGRI